jgi:hypothetical protein
MRLPEGVGPICGECPNRRGNRVKNPLARFFGHFRTQGLRRTAWKRKSAKSSRNALICLFWAFYIHFCAITNSLHIGFEPVRVATLKLLQNRMNTSSAGVWIICTQIHGAAPECAVYWHYWHFYCRFIGTELALFYHHPVGGGIAISAGLRERRSASW